MQTKIFLIFFSIYLVHGVPIKDHEDSDNELEEQVFGFMVEGDIPENPEDVQYPHPEFVAPLFVDEGNGHLHFTGINPCKSEIAGYINAENLEGRLMGVDQFKENYAVPEEIELKLVEDAEPIFDIQE